MTRSSILAAATSAAAAIALGLSPAAPAAVSAAQAPCGTFSGPAWTQVDTLTGQSQKGTTWKVIARRSLLVAPRAAGAQPESTDVFKGLA